MTYTLTIHREMTVEDLYSLPDELHYELYEGTLLVRAPAIAWHSYVISRITNLLREAGTQAFHEIGVQFGKSDMRAPDVAVFREKPDLTKACFPPEDFLLLVEVVSPSSEGFDRILKPIHYARAGIPEYWVVERDPADLDDAVVHQYRLAGGVYQEHAVLKLTQLEHNGVSES